jgi:geranylgeranyl pyrophosphate synthase
MKTFQLVDVALDIINKSVPKKVTSKRAKKIFKHLRGLLVALMITAIVTLTAAIDLRSAGEEIELIHLYSIGGGLGNGCI